MRVIAICLIALNLSLAGVWSSSGEDGINQAFSEYNNRVKQFNNEVIRNYERIINTQIEELVKNEELKKKLLTNHRELLKSESEEKQNINFSVEILKKLIDNQATK
ncbi:hypothetical protein [Campylobacter sp. CCUG 57310]|uniref:hypothetical protein n=1 Tax=Campylobacter sp. CCUG 57310 TaxID=2517362 RepID=UPI001563D57D|nr:hypothetical protein [Campylobacter sp. CCUG 57310]QKF93197.1 hypothetical protein CORI_a011 [Campylobacter sp. CCUG 57310]